MHESNSATVLEKFVANRLALWFLFEFLWLSLFKFKFILQFELLVKL